MNRRKGSVTFDIESHTAFCAVLKQSGVAVCFNTNSKELHVILIEDKNIRTTGLVFLEFRNGGHSYGSVK